MTTPGPTANRTKRKEREPQSLRLVCLSDTHGLHRQVTVPDGDILIHAGDLTVFDQPLSASLAMLEDVNAWLGELPHRHKVVIAGNHDLVFQQEPEKARRLLTHAHYLENSGVILEGLQLWGSPITPVMDSMAFATPRGEASRRVWDRIPNSTDILITHGPPCGTGDQTPTVESALWLPDFNRCSAKSSASPPCLRPRPWRLWSADQSGWNALCELRCAEPPADPDKSSRGRHASDPLTSQTS